MKNIKFQAISSIIPVMLLMLVVFSCKEEEEEFPITNDLRVLQVQSGDEIITTGAADISVIDEMVFIFSHGLDAAAFESALTLAPVADYTASYDESGSFVTLTFAEPLEYETEYVFGLPVGTYGADGQASVENFEFSFTTVAFAPPGVTLKSNVNKLFEEEAATITATLDYAITKDVSMDIVFTGTAEIDNDYAVDATSITIPAGGTADSIIITALSDGQLEGEENIVVTLENIVNAVESVSQQLDISLGDLKPPIELKGVMELDNYIGGTDGRVRAIQLHVSEDIPDLGIFGVEIASNGAAPDPNDIDFMFTSGESASAGDHILVIRDADVADAALFFGDCYAEFHIIESSEITQNGDDAILLYKNGIAVETFGEPGVDGTDTYWEYTDSWAYKLDGEWIYAGAGCVANGGGETNATTTCKYPFCAPLQLQGVSALLWDGSGTNGGKFVHVRANRDIDNLNNYGLGVANNGGGTDGIEFGFPQESAKEGDQILIAREPETIATYMGACYDLFDLVIQADAMTQNGDDAIELFDGEMVIETFGDADVDGTGQFWEYSGSWAYKGGGSWIFGGIDCASGTTSTQSSPCPYPLCD